MTAPTGGTPGAPTDGGTQAGQAPATGTQQPTTPPTTTTPPAGQQPETQDVSQLPAWAQKIINETRAEAAKHRTDKQTATQAAADAKAQRDNVLKALGLKEDGTEDVDPNKLTEQIDQYKAVAWENAVESQVVRLGHTLDIDVDALLDSNAFLNSLEDLVEDDPAGSEFKGKLEAHLKDFVEKHPKFKRTPSAPTRSGGTMPPGNPGTPNARPKSLSAAVKKALGG